MGPNLTPPRNPALLHDKTLNPGNVRAVCPYLNCLPHAFGCTFVLLVNHSLLSFYSGSFAAPLIAPEEPRYILSPISIMVLSLGSVLASSGGWGTAF